LAAGCLGHGFACVVRLARPKSRSESASGPQSGVGERSFLETVGHHLRAVALESDVIAAAHRARNLNSLMATPHHSRSRQKDNQFNHEPAAWKIVAQLPTPKPRPFIAPVRHRGDDANRRRSSLKAILDTRLAWQCPGVLLALCMAVEIAFE